MSGSWNAPVGIKWIEWISLKCCPNSRIDRMKWHQAGVLGLTYMAYTCYHLTRKPISVVKNVLSLNCTGKSPPPDVFINGSNMDTWCDWAPFGELIFASF